MAPTLAVAFKRRWWIAITAILENLTFAAVLLGWSSLLLMLKNEGFYAYLCYEDQNINVSSTEKLLDINTSTHTSLDGGSNWTDTSENHVKNSSELIRYMPSGIRTCTVQDEELNRSFSIGSCLLSAVTIVLGVIMDRYGSRMIRLTGSIIFMGSCVLFAIASKDPENLSMLMIPAVCMNGMGGITYIFTSFPIPNFFANLRSTMISLMIGSYSASALMYMLFKILYDNGVSFVFLMTLHGGIAFLTFVNAFINQPNVPIPAPGELLEIVRQDKEQNGIYDENRNTKKIENQHSLIGRRLSGKDSNENSNDNVNQSISDENETEQENKKEQVETFWQVLKSPIYIFSVVTMCLTQLRLIAYMGWLELYIKSSAERLGYEISEVNESIDFYVRLFGVLQINCFFMAPIIGKIMDWKMKQKNSDKNIKLNTLNNNQNDNKNGDYDIEEHFQSKKKQQIINLFRAFLITNVLLTLFGIIVLIDDILPLQIVAFILHTVIRTFLHSSTGGLYAAMYHFSHFGKLTGLTSFTGAVFILIQDPLFVFINNSLEQNPYWVNFGMLVFTLSGFVLPYLLWKEAKSISDYKSVSPEDNLCNGEEDNLVSSSRVLAGVKDDTDIFGSGLVF